MFFRQHFDEKFEIFDKFWRKIRNILTKSSKYSKISNIRKFEIVENWKYSKIWNIRKFEIVENWKYSKIWNSRKNLTKYSKYFHFWPKFRFKRIDLWPIFQFSQKFLFFGQMFDFVPKFLFLKKITPDFWFLPRNLNNKI